jgi:hypothetical protein
MFNRPLGIAITDNPIIDSPFVQQYNVGLGAFPSVPLWLLLDGEHFKTLQGADFAFLG